MVVGASDTPGLCHRSQSDSASEFARWWLLAVALLALLLVNLGNRGLNEPDEGRYSNIADEMLEGGHGWWEPRMSDFAHYDKPPMVYWVTAVAFEVFGRSEWAARFPCLLGAVLTLTGLGWATWRLHGSRLAWWAVLFCGTMGQFWVLGRMLTPDMLLTGFSTLAVAFWAEARHRQASLRWWWGCVLCATLAWWTKATAALVPLLGLTVGLLAAGDRIGLRTLRPLRLLLLVVLAGSPWYLVLMHRHPELVSFFFGREFAGRFLGHPDGRHGPVYFHLAFSLIGWAPWWPAALAALVLRRKEIGERLRQRRWQAVPVEAWMTMVGLAVFTSMSSKLVTYTLPFAPWAALGCARMILGQATGDRGEQVVRRTYLAAGAWAALFVVASFVMPHWESRLGAGSTMREVAQVLQQRHASVAYLDRYLPGMEFYFGESVYYVTDRNPRQLPTDAGDCEEIGGPHFLKPAQFSGSLDRHATNEIWLVRYRGRTNSPLCTALPPAPWRKTIRVGDFVLDALPRTAAAFTAVSAALQ